MKDIAGSQPAPRQALPCWFEEGKWQKPSWTHHEAIKQPWSLLSPLLPLFPFLLIFSILNKLHLVFYPTPSLPSFLSWRAAAAAAAKSLQSCPTLCDPIDGSPSGSSVRGILQAKNTGVGCHFLLQCMKVKSESEVAQSCPTLSDPMDCSLPGSSIHGIFQARVLEWVLKGWLSANPVPLTGHTCSLCFSTADALAQEEKWWELWPRWVPLLYSHLQNSLLLAP